MTRTRTAGPVVVLLALLPLALPAQVPEGSRGEPFVPLPEAEEAIGRLKSPFCPGLMLEVCPSPQAGILRDSIQMLAAEGLEADSIVEWMLANHGEEWRAMPKTEGSGLWAWIMPPAALLFGVGVVVVVLMRIRARRADDALDPPAQDPSGEDEARLRAAIREMEEAEEPLL